MGINSSCVCSSHMKNLIYFFTIFANAFFGLTADMRNSSGLDTYDIHAYVL